MSKRRVIKRFKDAYAMRKSIFLFFLFSFGMIVLFKTLKIINEAQHREQFHRIVTNKVDLFLSLF